MLTVLIPVKVPEPYLSNVLRRVQDMRNAYPDVISGVLTCEKGTLAEARRALAGKAQTEFVFNLDADTLTPVNYVQGAVSILQVDRYVGACALDYHNKPQGHPAFGTSIMRRELMLATYTWESIGKSKGCECLYMWRKLINLGYHIAWLPMEAEHRGHV